MTRLSVRLSMRYVSAVGVSATPLRSANVSSSQQSLLALTRKSANGRVGWTPNPRLLNRGMRFSSAELRDSSEVLRRFFPVLSVGQQLEIVEAVKTAQSQ